MEFWPAESSSSISKTKQNKNVAGKGSSRETWSCYPIIDHGAQSAATLVRVGDELEWRTVHSKRKGSLINHGQPSKVYPCTKPQEVARVNASLRRRAEHGASFLRSYHPDIDIPFDVLKDTLSDDDKARKHSEAFDPFAGNTLSATYCCEGIRKKGIALAFPTGNLGRELNISPMTTRNNSILFQPRTEPAWTFDTPIRQIVSSASAVDFAEKTEYTLAVRTYGQISVFDIRNQMTSLPESTKPPFTLTELVSIRRNDLHSSSDGGIVDIGFSSSTSGDVFFVTERGAGYRCSRSDENKVIQKICDVPSEGDNKFLKIISDQTVYGGTVASERNICKFDTRSFGTSISLLEYEDGRNVITSICPTQIEHMLCVSTTSQVIWIDERFAKQPLLGWRHHRAFDRSLSLQAIKFEDTSIAFLGSFKNKQVTAISVGKLQDGPLQCQMPSHALPAPGCDGLVSGRTLIRHPGVPPGSFSLLELSAQGSLHHHEFRYRMDTSIILPGQDYIQDRFRYKWSEGIHELDKHYRDLKPDYGNLASRQFALTDMSELYKALFGDEAQEARTQAEEAGAEGVYETLDNIPSFWQRSDTGEEHMRTLFDVVFDLGDKPVYEARADFLAGTVLDSARGYRARRQGRIPVGDVAKKAGWHTNIQPILQRISPNVFGASPTSSAELEPYHVGREEGIPEADRRESEAREQLALDLALSADVFSAVPIKDPSRQLSPLGGQGVDAEPDARTLTERTERLSLSGNEPPQVRFGFLRPINKSGENNYNKPEGKRREERAEEGETVTMPLGVRLLLSEWDVGDDPYAYEYIDPYDLDASPFTTIQNQDQTRHRKKQEGRSKEVESGSFRPAQSQAPPTIIAARRLKEKEVQPLITIEMRYGISQEELERARPHPPVLASTQVESGRFGGRQVGKKQPVKKRMGGF